MTAFRFVHAADLHLGTPFTGLAQVAPDWAAFLTEAAYQALNRIVDLCLEERVDALLLAGDSFDSVDAPLRARVRLARALARLGEAGIAVFVVHGNHDPLPAANQTGLAWPPNVHVFTDQPAVQPVLRAGQAVASVAGVSFAQREVRHNLAASLRPGPGGLPTVALLHTNVDGQPGHDNYAPCRLAELIASPFAYWALGHIHQPSVLHSGSSTVVYAGTPQGRDPNERGAHGCYLVTLGEGPATIRFVPTQTIVWTELTLSIDDLNSEAALAEEVEAGLQQALEQEGAQRLIARLRVVGRGPLHQQLVKPGAGEQLLATLRDILPTDRVWVDALRLRTQPALDLNQAAQENSLVGELVRTARAWLEQLEAGPGQAAVSREEAAAAAAPAVAALQTNLTAQWPASLRRHLPELTPEAASELLERALALALQRAGEVDGA